MQQGVATVDKALSEADLSRKPTESPPQHDPAGGFRDPRASKAPTRLILGNSGSPLPFGGPSVASRGDDRDPEDARSWDRSRQEPSHEGFGCVRKYLHGSTCSERVFRARV